MSSATAHVRRVLIGLTTVLLAGCIAATSARADSATLTFTDAAGKVDPVVGLGRTMTVSGNVSAPTRLYVLVRPAGGAPCAPSPRSDTAGDTYFGSFAGDSFYDRQVEGSFTLKKTGNWSQVGTFQFCTWLSANSSAASTPITSIVTFRNSGGIIAATLNPAVPTPKQSATVTITGTSEAPAEVFATVRPAGVPCAPSYRAETGEGLISDRDVSGAFSLTTTFTPSQSGPHVLCLFLAQSSTDANPIAIQPITFDVAAPCVVPAISKGSSLDAAISALSAASCAVGAQRLVPDGKVARGAVIGTATTAGTSLGTGAAVDLLISDGRNCTVPSSKPGLRRAQAKSKLAALGCTVGSITRVRSQRKKGTVVRFSPKAGTRLAPRAVVNIVISRGRR